MVIITSDYGKQWHGSGVVRIRGSLLYSDPRFFLGNTDPDSEPDPGYCPGIIEGTPTITRCSTHTRYTDNV
jgi:hypothetical protein